MATVIFYEKPGCANNSRQKLWLKNAGHRIYARNLLKERWTRDKLLAFFGTRPVVEWFNRASPRIKNGEIVPARLDTDKALELMLADPLLIRRPLLESQGRREVGFDPEVVDAWLGLSAINKIALLNGDTEDCLHPDETGHCTPSSL